MQGAKFLGQISYSVYLWHALVIFLVSSALLYYVPHLTQVRHVSLLIPLTVLFTTWISAYKFAFIERPGMAMGQRLADAFIQRRIAKGINLSTFADIMSAKVVLLPSRGGERLASFIVVSSVATEPDGISFGGIAH